MRVVDAQTNEPLADAIVVYELHSATSHGTNYTQHAVYETVSNDAGFVNIPPQVVTIVTTAGPRNPTLKVFKNGYMPSFIGNERFIIPELKDALVWEKNGGVIRLRPP